MIDQDSYTEICGCIWKNGERIYLCPRHKHKDIPIRHLPNRRKYEQDKYRCEKNEDNYGK